MYYMPSCCNPYNSSMEWLFLSFSCFTKEEVRPLKGPATFSKTLQPRSKSRLAEYRAQTLAYPLYYGSRKSVAEPEFDFRSTPCALTMAGQPETATLLPSCRGITGELLPSLSGPFSGRALWLAHVHKARVMGGMSTASWLRSRWASSMLSLLFFAHLESPIWKMWS